VLIENLRLLKKYLLIITLKLPCLRLRSLLRDLNDTLARVHALAGVVSLGRNDAIASAIYYINLRKCFLSNIKNKRKANFLLFPLLNFLID
jgi:hypothetical protein